MSKSTTEEANLLQAISSRKGSQSRVCLLLSYAMQGALCEPRAWMIVGLTQRDVCKG